MNLLRILRGGPGEGKKLLKNTSWLFIGEIVGRLIRFWIVVYAARVLGASEYGLFSYALTVAAFASILADIGISALLTRETSKDPSLRQRYFNALFVVKIGLIAAVGGALYLLLPAFAGVDGIHPLVVLIIAMFAFDSIREFGFGIQRGMEQMEREAITKIVMNVLITGFGFLALFYQPTAYSLSVGYVAGAGLGCFLTVFLLRDFFLRIKEGVSWQLIVPLLKLALPIGLLQLLGAIMINTDMLMLGWWEAPEALGYYGAAQKIILLLYVAPALIAGAAFPLFARLAGAAQQQFREVFEKTICASELLALPLAVGGIVLSSRLMSLLFGPEYLPGSLTLALLMGTLVIVFPSTLFSNALFAYNKQRLFTGFVAIGVGSNILFNWLFIPEYGIAGAALATILAQIIANVFIWRAMAKTNPFRVLAKLQKITLASFVMGFACFALAQTQLHTLLIVVLGAALYIGLLVLLREPILKEIRGITARS